MDDWDYGILYIGSEWRLVVASRPVQLTPRKIPVMKWVGEDAG
jgi:hypothetical protein